jgi:beta-glucosidase
VTDGGYLHGALAPGHRNLYEAPIASHHLLRAHGKAVQAYRAVGRHQIGIVVNIEPKHPASDSLADLQATQRADAYMNRQYLDPLIKGVYPDEMGEVFGEAWPHWPQGDMDLIRQPIDFLGVNYYTRGVTRHDPAAWPVHGRNVPPEGALTTETGWEIYPEGLTETLVWIKRRYGDIPLYITENGAALKDPPLQAGRMHDHQRVDYLRRHLQAAHGAIAAGVDLRGYMVWSLFDNLEWSLGFSKRFGIIHVDLETQVRTPKDSALFYADVIATNGAAALAAAAA